MIKFKCTKCAHEYQVGDDYAGRKVRCKNCNTVNVVPKPETPGCGDSLARYNSLLQELLEYEKKAPPYEVETNK
jgi:DNA-directed RNA polymerase subunit RPC12/RpoP